MNETDVMPGVRSEWLLGVKVHAVVIGMDSYIPLTEIRNKVNKRMNVTCASNS